MGNTGRTSEPRALSSYYIVVAIFAESQLRQLESVAMIENETETICLSSPFASSNSTTNEPETSASGATSEKPPTEKLTTAR